MGNTGFLDRPGGDGVRPHQLYVPRNYSADRRWPLILFLHGAGEGGEDGLLPTEFQLGSAIRRHPEVFPALVLFPQQAPNDYWRQRDLTMARVCLEQVCDDYSIDPGRISLCGVSSGATGAWALASRHPELFQALLIVGGLVAPNPAHPASEAVVPMGVADPHAWLAERLRRLPVWIHHGDGDPLCPVEDARCIATCLKRQGAAVRYSELPGFGHNVWDVAFYSAAVARWLLDPYRPETARQEGT